MSWTKLAPIVKSTGRPMASASITVNKDKTAKLSLILSASLKDEFGDVDHCDVSAGTGENVGKLLVEMHAGGAFEVKNFVHGGGRIFIPVPGGCPDRATASESCVISDKVVTPGDVEVGQERDHPQFVVTLPIEAWGRQLQERAPKPPSGGSALQPPPPAGQGRERRRHRRGRVSDGERPEGRPLGRRALAGRRRDRHPWPGGQAGQSASAARGSRSRFAADGAVRRP
jgi:hypothetical protein